MSAVIRGRTESMSTPTREFAIQKIGTCMRSDKKSYVLSGYQRTCGFERSDTRALPDTNL